MIKHASEIYYFNVKKMRMNVFCEFLQYRQGGFNLLSNSPKPYKADYTIIRKQITQRDSIGNVSWLQFITCIFNHT